MKSDIGWYCNLRSPNYALPILAIGLRILVIRVFFWSRCECNARYVTRAVGNTHIAFPMDDSTQESCCHVCSRLYEFQTDNQSIPYAELEESVEGGCPTCYIMSEGITRVWNNIGFEENPVKLTINGIRSDRSVATVLCWAKSHRPGKTGNCITVHFSCVGDSTWNESRELHFLIPKQIHRHLSLGTNFKL